MKRIRNAYEASDGTLHKTRKNAAEQEAAVAHSKAAKKWFLGYLQNTLTAAMHIDELLQDLIEMKTWMSEAGMLQPDKEESEDKIPF